MNIISIDLDILFQCHKYEKYIFYDIEPKMAWKVIDLLNIEYSPDYEKIYKLLNIIRDIPKEKRYIIENHEEILDFLKEYKNVNLYNFDYHHDTGYKEFSYTPNGGNWVLFAKNNKYIKNYFWFKNEFSDIQKNKPFYFEEYNILDEYSLPKFDMAVICISKHYTPFKYWDLCQIFKEEE